MYQKFFLEADCFMIKLLQWFLNKRKENITSKVMKNKMKLISWNVNGIRACMGKGFMDFFEEVDADIFALQETKVSEGQIELKPEGYFDYWNFRHISSFLLYLSVAMNIHFGSPSKQNHL